MKYMQKKNKKTEMKKNRLVTHNAKVLELNISFYQKFFINLSVSITKV